MHRRLHLNSEVRPIGNSSPQLTIQWAVDLIHHRSKCQFKQHILPKLSVFQQDKGHSKKGLFFQRGRLILLQILVKR